MTTEITTLSEIRAILNDARTAAESLDALSHQVAPRGLDPEATEEDHATHRAQCAVLARWDQQEKILHALAALRDLESACIAAAIKPAPDVVFNPSGNSFDIR